VNKKKSQISPTQGTGQGVSRTCRGLHDTRHLITMFVRDQCTGKGKKAWVFSIADKSERVGTETVPASSVGAVYSERVRRETRGGLQGRRTNSSKKPDSEEFVERGSEVAGEVQHFTCALNWRGSALFLRHGTVAITLCISWAWLAARSIAFCCDDAALQRRRACSLVESRAEGVERRGTLAAHGGRERWWCAASLMGPRDR
jgi:hypothetical protein